jgi:hypothetical protein
MNKQTNKDSGTHKIPPRKVGNFCFNKAVADNTDKCGIRIRFVVVYLTMLPINKIIKHQR